MIAQNELFDRVLAEATMHDAFKVLISAEIVSYRVADPVRGACHDGTFRLPPPVEIHESDLEQILAGSWVRGQVEDSYEYEGAQLKVLAGRYPDAITVNFAKAANFEAYREQQAAL